MQWWCAATSAPWSWAWRAYPGVWLFVAALVVVGVRARARALPYAAGVLCAWLALDWPLGTLGGGYLLAAHTAQYVVLTFFAAPLLLIGLKREGGGGAGLPALHPLAALLVYNALLGVTHVPAVSDAMMRSQGGSAVVDLAWLFGGLALWSPVLHPDAARRLKPPLAMGYLFVSTLLPTLPAALLIFGDYPYYGVYELAPRAFGMSALQDQQLAGLIMKVIGDPIAWGSTAVIFFRWQAAQARVTEETTLTLPRG